LDPTLVDKITREVLTALGASAPWPRAETEPAASPQTPQPSGPAGQVETDDNAPSRRIFITAEMLAERLAASSGQTLELAANERLTPAAQDLAARKNITIVHTAVAAPTAATKTPVPRTSARSVGLPLVSDIPSSGAGPVGLIVERPTEKVGSVLSALKHDGIRLLEVAASDCWVENLLALSRSVAAGTSSLGVALLPYAADAMVIANKVKGIRAVQGTRPASVAGAIRHVGANLLVLEHELSTFYELRQMVRVFIRDRMICGAAQVAMQAIKQLEGTG